MRALTTAVVAVLTALPLAWHPTSAHALAPQTYERQAVEATNDQRVDHDLRRLRTDKCLARFANRHAEEMANEHRIFHQDLRPIIRRCGLSRVGENVAVGYRSGRSVVRRGWMRSAGHRANILTRPFRYVSVGAAQAESGDWYTAQVLARR